MHIINKDEPMMQEVLQDENPLLKPIGEKATGHDLRNDAEFQSYYYDIRRARKQASQAERDRMYEGQADFIVASEWSNVLKLSKEILENISKDLEVASYYMEALVRTNSVQGLNLGLKNVFNIMQAYWDDMFPQIQDNNFDERLAPLQALCGSEDATLIVPANNFSVSDRVGMPNYVYWQYTQALDVEQINDPETKLKRYQTLSVKFEDIDIAINGTPESFYKASLTEIGEILTTINLIESLLVDKIGEDTACFIHLTRSLSDYQALMQKILDAKEKKNEKAVAVEEDNEDGGELQIDNAEFVVEGKINRDAINEKLLELADIYDEYEPHSPLAYILKQSAEFVQLPLPKLMQKLLPDNNAYEMFCRFSGIEYESGYEHQDY